MDLQHVDEPIHVAAVKNLPRQLLHKQGSRKGSFPPAKLANTMPKECRSIEFEAHGTGAMAAELHTPVKRPQTLSAAPATLHGHWYRQHSQAPPCSRALDFSSPVHGECRRKFQDPLEDPQRAELQEFGAISNLVTPLFSPTTRPAGLNHHAGCSVPDTALLQKSFSFPLSPTHDKSWRDVSIEGVPNRKRCHVWPSSARQSYSEEDSQHILSNIDEDEGVDVDIDVNSQNPEEMFKFPISEDQLGNSLSDMTPMEVAEVIEDLLKEQLASTMCLQTALQRLTSACIEVC